jgi:4'-phosphopantetheinyl transferase
MMQSQSGIRWMTQCLADVPRHNGWLTSGELEVLASKTVLKRRADWRLGRWTAKQALRAHHPERDSRPDYNEIEIRAAADGAPEVFLRGGRAPVTLSLTHSHGVAMCAVAEPGATIGCDAEYIEERSDALVTDYFAESERDIVCNTPPPQRPLVTTLIWSAKESVLKAMREGMRRDPRDVVIEFTPDELRGEWNAFVASYKKSGEAFHGWWRVSDTHVYTVAGTIP